MTIDYKGLASLAFALALTLGCQAEDDANAGIQAQNESTAVQTTAEEDAGLAAGQDEKHGESGADRTPEETRKANVPSQTPALPGQTRAPKPVHSHEWQVQVIAEGLDHPWAVEVLPDGTFLVTERPGSLRVVRPQGDVSDPIAGVPEVFHFSQGGLLDVALAPDFSQSGVIYLSYAEPRDPPESGTTVAKGRLNADRTQLENVQVVFRMLPKWASRGHYGSRLVFDDSGADNQHLFITLGERMNEEPRQMAQSYQNHIGTVVRVHPDGSVPQDNPFVGTEGAAEEVWSYGHRNI